MKKQEKLTLDIKITETLDEMLARLELHKGAWAIEIKGNLLVFPQHNTKAEVESVLREAYSIASGTNRN